MRNLRYVPLVVLVALAGFTAGCGGSDSSSSGTDPVEGPMWSGTAPNTEPMAAPDSARIDAAAEGVIKNAEGALPGLWLAVSDPKKGTHSGAYGRAVLPDVAATVDDHGRIGSLTKTFTATAVLKLIDTGDLELGDTISELLPDLASAHPRVGQITIEQLLGMTSGIPDYANTSLVLQQVVRTPERLWTPDEIIELTLRKLKLEKAGSPGYSTTNFLILGEILSETTGESIETVLNEAAADAGLDQTKLPPGDENDMPDPASHGYVNAPGAASLATVDIKVRPGVDATDWSQSWGGAGGSMYSTVDELGRWAATGLGTSQLSRSLGEKRLDDRSELEGLGGYGLGLQHFGPDWIGHTGQIIGWEALAMYNPKTGGTISVIINETGSIGAAIQMILKLYPELTESDFT